MSNDKRCVICGITIDGRGNNAQPVKNGRCCDTCNITKVVPARLEIKYNKGEK